MPEHIRIDRVADAPDEAVVQADEDGLYYEAIDKYGPPAGGPYQTTYTGPEATDLPTPDASGVEELNFYAEGDEVRIELPLGEVITIAANTTYSQLKETLRPVYEQYGASIINSIVRNTVEYLPEVMDTVGPLLGLSDTAQRELRVDPLDKDEWGEILSPNPESAPDGYDERDGVYVRSDIEIAGYSDLPPEDAPPEVLDFLARKQREMDDPSDEEVLLFQLLGTGAYDWKFEKAAVNYRTYPVEGDEGSQYCGNCSYAYHSNETGNLICSKVTAPIGWRHWCNRWSYAESDRVLQDAYPDVSEDELVPLDVVKRLSQLGVSPDTVDVADGTAMFKLDGAPEDSHIDLYADGGMEARLVFPAVPPESTPELSDLPVDSLPNEATVEIEYEQSDDGTIPRVVVRSDQLPADAPQATLTRDSDGDSPNDTISTDDTQNAHTDAQTDTGETHTDENPHELWERGALTYNEYRKRVTGTPPEETTVEINGTTIDYGAHPRPVVQQMLKQAGETAAGTATRQDSDPDPLTLAERERREDVRERREELLDRLLEGTDETD